MIIRASVARDLSDSAFDMQRLVWPAIASWCGAGEFYPVESKADVSLAQDLDILAGIDGFQKRYKQGVIRGIASRIQWGTKDWGTFTIRLARKSGNDTEVKKRLFALAHRDEGYLYPAITVQAYITERRVGSLVSVAVAHTKELIPWAYQTWTSHRFHRAANNPTGVWEKESYDTDGSWARFLCVDWDVYEAAGYFIKQWHCKDLTVLGEPMPQFLDWVEEMEAVQP